jgi:colanic acid/amylovoran biosynthesis glycosyltransferase
MLDASPTQSGTSGRMPSDKKLSLAYLVGQYPAVTHSFILREITQLRQLGLDIHTVSVNSAKEGAGGLTDAESREVAQTFYVKERSLLKILFDHVVCVVRRPRGYLRGLVLAIQLGGLDLKAIVFHWFYFIEAVVMGQWMLRQKLRHVHVHFANASSTVALIASKIFEIQYSITVHGPDEFYDVGYYHLSSKIAGAAFLCCISHFCRSQLMKASSPEQWDKFELSRLGVDPAVFDARPVPDGEVFKVLCTGRLVPAKGQAILLLAVANLLRAGRRVHLHLVGGGPDEVTMENIADKLGITNSITSHGAINQDRLRSILTSADVFVLPSFAEGVPVALMEAMAMQIPCVSTYIAGIPELIEPGISGLLVFASDPELLTQALESLMDDREFALCLGKAGRRKVIECYNLEANVRHLAAIFDRRLSA